MNNSKDKDIKQIQHSVSRGKAGTTLQNSKYLNLSKSGTGHNMNTDSIDSAKFFRVVENRKTSQMSNQRRTNMKCGEMSSSDE